MDDASPGTQEYIMLRQDSIQSTELKKRQSPFRTKCHEIFCCPLKQVHLKENTELEGLCSMHLFFPFALFGFPSPPLILSPFPFLFFSFLLCFVFWKGCAWPVESPNVHLWPASDATGYETLPRIHLSLFLLACKCGVDPLILQKGLGAFITVKKLLVPLQGINKRTLCSCHLSCLLAAKFACSSKRTSRRLFPAPAPSPVPAVLLIPLTLS